MPLLTLNAFIFAVVHAQISLGWSRALLLLGLTFGVSLLYESVGVVTGWIYGPYHYTDHLGPRFLGLVPYLIPLAWFMMAYPSQVIAESLLERCFPARWRRVVGLAAASAVVMTAWDVIMDPIMVRMGFWVWEVDGAYFGVPLRNYAGWLVTTFTFFLLYRLLEQRMQTPPTIQVPRSFLRLAAWSYLITWVSNTMAAFQMDLGGPALAGAFSVGAIALFSVLRFGVSQNRNSLIPSAWFPVVWVLLIRLVRYVG
jgi:putative membrane protein